MMLRDLESSLGKRIDKQSVAFIASVDGEGFPAMKAMLAPRHREGLRTFLFTTNTYSMPVAHYRVHPKAAIYFCDRRFYRGVMLQGLMDVLTDQLSKQAIWLDTDIQYYPGGVTDPDYCVLRFTASQGRYYSNFRSVNFKVDAI